MKFDASRAESHFQELGDPRYAGPDGEQKVADLVVSRFQETGFTVERRDVTGSRFPQRVSPWVGWLGYGCLVTLVYVLALQHTVLALTLAFILSYSCFPWLDAVVSNRIRPGRRMAPLETAPVVIASLPGEPRGQRRVVFQAIISGLKADPFHFAIKGPMRLIVFGFLCIFPTFWFIFLLIYRWALFENPGRMDARVGPVLLIRWIYPAFLASVWLGILVLLSLEYRQRRSLRERPIERRGLALLLEMARTWPRTGSRSIEPVFVAAGGQGLDHAGSREIVRRLGSDWASRPTLLILFFAPGAGDRLWACSNDTAASGTQELAEVAASSLWLPIRKNEPFALLPLWPFEQCRPCVALIGSDPRAFSDDSVDSQALNRAAQLATEIALRWAKKQQATGE